MDESLVRLQRFSGLTRELGGRRPPHDLFTVVRSALSKLRNEGQLSIDAFLRAGDPESKAAPPPHTLGALLETADCVDATALWYEGFADKLVRAIGHSWDVVDAIDELLSLDTDNNDYRHPRSVFWDSVYGACAEAVCRQQQQQQQQQIEESVSSSSYSSSLQDAALRIGYALARLPVDDQFVFDRRLHLLVRLRPPPPPSASSTRGFCRPPDPVEMLCVTTQAWSVARAVCEWSKDPQSYPGVDALMATAMHSDVGSLRIVADKVVAISPVKCEEGTSWHVDFALGRVYCRCAGHLAGSQDASEAEAARNKYGKVARRALLVRLLLHSGYTGVGDEHAEHKVGHLAGMVMIYSSSSSSSSGSSDRNAELEEDLASEVAELFGVKTGVVLQWIRERFICHGPPRSYYCHYRTLPMYPDYMPMPMYPGYMPMYPDYPDYMPASPGGSGASPDRSSPPRKLPCYLPTHSSSTDDDGGVPHDSIPQ